MLAACTEVTAPGAGPSGSPAISRGLAAIERASASPAVQAVEQLGRVANGARAHIGASARASTDPLMQLSSVPVASGTTMATLLRPAALGRVFRYEPAQGRYVATSERGAPTNGVRVILYDALATGEPNIEKETGYADLSNVDSLPRERTGIRMAVVMGGATRLVYTVSTRTDSAAANVIAEGVVTESADSVFFRVDASRAAPDERPRALRSAVRVPSEDLEVYATLASDNASSDQTIELVIASFPHETILDWRVRAGRLTATIIADGQIVARADGTPATPRYLGADGEPLPEGTEEWVVNYFAWFDDLVSQAAGFATSGVPLLEFAAALGG
ncbi:MAG: hypothetical protein MUF00_00070 [Gemmatimonadaceae bacterium]|jgi:hypothetical protein|nr:hypothetical protein [Gemmatimonadaceae bacterium]